MKIIYSGLKYSNYNPDLGLSFEHINFYEFLKLLPNIEVIYFPYDDILKIGKNGWNKKLLSIIKEEKPDIFFAFMFTDEFDKNILEEIKKYTKSIAWFSDDHWRFDNYSKYYAQYFSLVITTYSKAVEKYNKIGAKNVIRSQWAANIETYKPILRKEEQFEVSFVGTWSRPRQKIISQLQKAGINVIAYGSGWPAGKVSQQKMMEIFSNSKINLALNPASGYFNVNSLGRLFLKRSINKIIPSFNFINNFKCWISRGISQIKARHFEIPACGGFLITSMADDLGSYYKIGEEIVVYKNIDDLISKIKYYLKNENERIKIAAAGYEKTLKNHAYNERLDKIFKEILK